MHAQGEPGAKPWSESRYGGSETELHKKALFALLQYHLNLFDEWEPTLGRPFETLKRFFKIYIRDFDGASEVRDKLMHTTSTGEVREILSDVDGGASRQL